MLRRSFLGLLASAPVATKYDLLAEINRPVRDGLEICAYCQAPTWCEVRKNGKPQCKACKVERFFNEILYKPIGFRLLDWQRRALRDIYGTVDEKGIRRYRRAYISVPKKNGKSFLVGGLPLYHLLMENEMNASAYGAAAAKDQAGLVFRAATELIRRNPMLSSRLKVLGTVKRIVRRDGAGFYAVISGDGDMQDGIEPSLAILDELHRWRTPKAETNYDVITKGTISRKEPLVVEITTAGEIADSPICWREHEFAQQVLDGSLKSDRFYASIYSADAQRIGKEPDYWISREARVTANPSHEDHGGFLKDEAIVEELSKAIAIPATRNAYLRYHLNIWVEAEERFIDPAAWERCNLPQRSLVGRPCYIGLDLSSTIDLTAMVCVFPDADGTYDVTAKFWMASEQVPTRERKDRVEYSTWIRQGYLNVSEGWAIDEEDVRQAIKAAAGLYDLRMICYDPRFATSLVNKLINEDGFLCVKIPQGFQALTNPTKTLQSLILDGKIRHGGHPILNWNCACASSISDKKDGVMLSKPDRMRSGKRIDGMAALVNAMAQAAVQQQQGEMIGFY